MFRPFATAKVTRLLHTTPQRSSRTPQGAYFSFILFFISWILFICAIAGSVLISASGDVHLQPTFSSKTSAEQLVGCPNDSS
jgi:hypothetical protein